MRPAGREETKRVAPRGVASDYRNKTAYEISRLSRRMQENGYPAPLGDPTSGIVLVVDQPVGPRVLEALKLSLQTVGIPGAYVTYSSTGLLSEELLATEPCALVALGPGAVHDIDALAYPLAQSPFSEAERGVWFPWTKGITGLVLPALAPVLDDDAAKRHFWRSFLTLKDLGSTP